VTLLLLLACGPDPDLAQANPPPTPPPVLEAAEQDVERLVGAVQDPHGPTRSFVVVHEGRRWIAHLVPHATLRLDDRAALAAELPIGATVELEGRSGDGDLFLVERAVARAPSPEIVTVPTAGAPPPPPGEPTPPEAPTPR
jgi:hypothetical protein